MPSALILDENAPIRELLREWLCAAGYQVFEAQNRRELAAARMVEIDVLLIDLPVLREGAQLVVAPLRALLPQTALVGLSARLGASVPAHSTQARELGLDALLAKPCTREELLGVLAQLGVAP